MILDKLGVSLTIGATLGIGFFKTMRKAEATTASLGDAWKKTNAQLKSAESVIHYKTRLEKLQARQTKLGGSSTRLGKLIDKTDRKYQITRMTSPLKSKRHYLQDCAPPT